MPATLADRVLHGALCAALLAAQSAPAAEGHARKEARSMTVNRYGRPTLAEDLAPSVALAEKGIPAS
jgi:hypothetical protein